MIVDDWCRCQCPGERGADAGEASGEDGEVAVLRDIGLDDHDVVLGGQ